MDKTPRLRSTPLHQRLTKISQALPTLYLVTLGTLAILAIDPVHAHPSSPPRLFEIVSPTTTPTPTKGNPAVHRSCRIQFRPELLDYDTPIPPGTTWSIPLPDGSSMQFRVTDTDHKAPERRILMGQIDNQAGSLGILAAAGSAITGTMTAPNRGRFQFEYLGDDRYRLNEIDTSTLPLCATGRVGAPIGTHPLREMARRSKTETTPQPRRRQAPRRMLGQDGPVLDIMMVYSHDALEGAGGPDGIQSVADYAEAEANQIFANSELNLRVNFVHHEVLDHTETGNLPTDVSLANNSVGKLNLRALRKRHGADLILLLVETDLVGWSGFSPILKQEGGQRQSATAGVRRRWLTAGFYLFTHEICHSLGCQHDSRSATNTAGNLLPGLFPHSLAHRFKSDNVTYVTTMGYSPGITLPYLSNPDVTYENVPTGEAEQSDNVATIQFSAPIVAQYEAPESWFRMDAAVLEVSEGDAPNLQVPIYRMGDFSSEASLTVTVTPEATPEVPSPDVSEYTVVFAPGDPVVNLSIPIEDDLLEQADRSLQVRIASVPDGAAISHGITEVRIMDDDWLVDLPAEDRTAFESAGILAIPLKYVGTIAPGESLELRYELIAGTAEAGEDYLEEELIVSFSETTREQLIQIPILDDDQPEPDENLQLKIGPQTINLTILDNDRIGSLDPTFTQAGNTPNGNGWTLGVHGEDRIFLGGDFDQIGNATRHGIARLILDGGLDEDFIVAPIVAQRQASASPQKARVVLLAPLPNGQVAVGGIFATVDGNIQPNLALLNADGSFDSSFRPVFDGALQNAVALPDGRIMAAGRFENVNGVPRKFIARLLPDGSNDPTFQPNPGPDRFSGRVTGLALQPDGKILIGGRFDTVDGEPHGNLARLNSDGTVDSTFQVPQGGIRGHVRAIKLIPDGRIYVSGEFTTVSGRARRGIARFMPNGEVDTSFAITSAFNRIVTDIQPLPDGRVIVVGEFTRYKDTPVNRIVLLQEDGSLDTTFDPGLGANDTIFAVTSHPDGWLYVSGMFTEFAGTSVNRIARLKLSLPLPEIDGIQNTSGVTTLRVAGTPGAAFSIETSVDLLEWSHQGDYKLTEASLTVTDERTASEPHRFYRIGARK